MATNIIYNPNDDRLRQKNLGFTSYTARERKYEPQTQNTFAMQFLFDRGQVAYIAAAANASSSGIPGAEIISYDYNQGLKQINDILNCSLQSINSPTKSIQQIIVDFFNSQIKYAGKPTYNEANITLNTFIGLGSKNVLSAWSDMCLNNRSLAGGWARSVSDFRPQTFNPMRMDLDDYLSELTPNIGYKVDGILLECARDGTIVNQWDYIGMWLQQFTPGSFNMSGSSSTAQVSGIISVDMIQQSSVSYTKANTLTVNRDLL